MCLLPACDNLIMRFLLGGSDSIFGIQKRSSVTLLAEALG